MYELPIALDINGKSYNIRSDFRAALDIIAALNDINLTEHEKAWVTLEILYVDSVDYADIPEALEKAKWFINCGDNSMSGNVKHKVMDWEQDFKYIVAPINKTLGYECRAVAYLHWWTFISAYYEIGDCTFSNLVNIRNKLAKGKKLEKWEREFYQANREMIDLKARMTDEEQALIDEIMGNLP